MHRRLGEAYHHLSRAAVCATPLMEEPDVDVIQTLVPRHFARLFCTQLTLDIVFDVVVSSLHVG